MIAKSAVASVSLGINPGQIKKFQRALVAWFRRSARDLPWRKTSDPYRIWISEVMLQQTGVSTVIPYYERFLKRFPTIETLAESSEQEVLHLWQGLGYYRRAKNLRLGAKMIVEKFGGQFPESRDELLSVPGIGPYSAGAILSIAFRKSQPALDGNLIRVYSRLHSIEDFVDESSTLKRLWETAREYSPKDPRIIREFTEGMMELGACLCLPRKPLCLICPVRIHCKAYLESEPENYPRKRKKEARKKLFEEVLFIEEEGRIAFLEKGSDPKFPDFLRLPFRSIQKEKAPKTYELRMKYSVTVRDFTVFVKKSGGSALDQNLVWLSSEEIQAALLPAIDRKILRELA